MSLLSKGIRGLTKCIHGINSYSLQLASSSLVTSRSVSSKSGTVGRGIFKLGLTGITVGALVGTGYSIHHMNKPRGHILNEESFIPLVPEIPKITPSRKVRVLEDKSGLKLTLFQYQTCPFCCKVRAFLDYYGISYDIVEVDPVLRQSIKWSPYKKVPILVVQTEEGYQPLNDSTMIISALSSFVKDGQKDMSEIVKCFPFISYYDDGGTKRNDIMNKYFLMLNEQKVEINKEKDMIEERKWRKWADDVLVHTLSPNVYRTKEEAMQAFNWFSEVGEWEKHFPSWERNLIIYVGAGAMWLIGKRLKKRHNLKEDVRESLYDECNHWVREINKKGTKFMGGDSPNLADLAVFGVLSSIEGCTAFKDLLSKNRINMWYFSMKEVVNRHDGINRL